MNWQYSVNHNCLDNSRCMCNCLPDFECIQIRKKYLEIQNDATVSKYMKCEAIGLDVNMYSMVVTNVKKHIKLLKPNKNNNRL